MLKVIPTIENFILEKQRRKLAFVAGVFGLSYEDESRGSQGTGGGTIVDAAALFWRERYARGSRVEG